MTAVLEARNIHKSFGAIKVAEDVTLAIPKGARHALIGPNGAGKTTLINLITGRLRPSAGAVFIDGEDVTSLSEHQRIKRGIGRTFQINSLFLGLTVLENVTLSAAEHAGISWQFWRPLGSNRKLLEFAYETLERVHLAEEADRRLSDLSYGMQRLLEIAVALAQSPRIILLDEPAAGVPAGEHHAILDTLREMPSDVSILMIEHDMDLVFSFADYITVLDQGRVVAEGAPAEIAQNQNVQTIYFGEREVHGR